MSAVAWQHVYAYVHQLLYTMPSASPQQQLTTACSQIDHPQWCVATHLRHLLITFAKVKLVACKGLQNREIRLFTKGKTNNTSLMLNGLQKETSKISLISDSCNDGQESSRQQQVWDEQEFAILSCVKC